MRTVLALLVFVSLVSLAEGPTNSLKLQLQWDQDASRMSNILYYVTHHGGADGVMTNYGKIYPFQLRVSGMVYPASLNAWLTQDLVQGTNYVGLSAVMAGGLGTETNVISTLVDFNVPLK